jgi:glutathione S-transferase
MITLYGVPRSRAMRVLWMLEELALPYDHVKTDFATGDTRAPEFLRLNPNGHIPVIRDGDFVLWESMAINLYLARKYDRGLWPATVEDEGRAFQWSVWAMTELEEPVLTALLHRLVYPEEQRDPGKAADAAQRFATPLGVLDGQLAGRSHLVGDRFGVADLNVASVLVWAPLAGLDLGSAPHAQAWLAGCTERPAFRRVRQKSA